MNLEDGIYEQLISDKINQELIKREDEIIVRKEEMEKEEAKVILSKYLFIINIIHLYT